jgi:hypothetical protein
MFSTTLLLGSPDPSGRIMVELRILSQLFYHCATRTQLNWEFFFQKLLFLVSVVGFKPLKLGFLVLFSITLPLGSPGASVIKLFTALSCDFSQ